MKKIQNAFLVLLAAKQESESPLQAFFMARNEDCAVWFHILEVEKTLCNWFKLDALKNGNGTATHRSDREGELGRSCFL